MSIRPGSTYTGTKTLANGASYRGEMVDGKAHGQGTYTWADGRRYEGGWRDDKQHGQGTHTWADGDRYEGQYQEGDMHGQGTFTAAAGWSFTGNLQKDRPTEGVLTEGAGRRFRVTYRRNCAVIFKHPSPTSKTELGGAGAGGEGSAGAGAAPTGPVSTPAGGGVTTPETATAGSKRRRTAVYASLLSPRRAKAARTGEAGGAAGPAAGAAGRGRPRPAYDADEVEKLVEVLYRWDWRTSDGTYEAFDKQQCMTLETCYRQGMAATVVWGRRFPVGDNEELKCMVDFEDMTAAIAGTEWVTAVRRWDRDERTGEGWDHQDENLLIVDVQKGWRDYTIVESALYDRPREDGREPSIRRQSHEVVRVRRIQNRGQYDLFKAQQRKLELRRGKKEVELTQRYAWHGSGKTRPDEIASKEGFLMQFNSHHGFYQQGAYFAEQASYSHHEKYVYRSTDEAGEHQCDTGKFHHLLLVNVLRGKPLKTAEVWRGEGFGSVQSKLGQEHDSVEGGPHRPMFAGRGPDDSLMYVVYQSSQCLPEFIVTYRERAV